MPDEQLFREVESSPVQLARIEGKIDLIKYQGDVMSKDMTHMKTDVERLKTDVHTLQLNEVARDKLAATVATTLKDKDLSDVANSEKKWTPVSKFYATVVAIAAASDVLYIFYKILHP